MESGHGRLRHAWALGFALAGILLACQSVFALNPALDVSQYAHTPWRFSEGFSRGQIYSIAQTADGYLWLGTDFGLLRFDGVKPTLWSPTSDQTLPSSQVKSLLAARDGALWIGTSRGLARWKDFKLTEYEELSGLSICALLQDRAGTIWVGIAGPPIGRLCAIQNDKVQSYGADGSFGVGSVNLYEDKIGNLWVGTKDGIWRWKGGDTKFYSLAGDRDGIQGLGEDADGALLVGWNGGMYRFIDGKTVAYPLPAGKGRYRVNRILRDRDGSLWIGTQQQGLLHLHQGRSDAFSLPQGLSGEDVLTLFEDQEGSVWVATLGGLDRFHDLAVATFTVNQGLSSSLVGAVLGDANRSVWMCTLEGLNLWDNGEVTVLSVGGAGGVGKARGPTPQCIFRDDKGRIWVSTNDGVGYIENGKFVAVNGVPGGIVHSMVQDIGGNLWIANQDVGLVSLSEGGEVQSIPKAQLGHDDPSTALAADRVQGGIWIGFYQGGVAYLKEGAIRASITAANGLGAGRVNSLRIDRDGALWAATEGGLSRLKDGRVSTLSRKDGLPCDAVHWMIEDRAGSYWLDTACGLVRISGAELQAWVLSMDKNEISKKNIQPTVFDSSDGVRSLASASGYSPPVTQSADGTLWFAGYNGVCSLDPGHIPFNNVPPPVHIEQIIADHKASDLSSTASELLQLPALIRDLQIDYSALSLMAPEKVLFRYKLENWDQDWQEGGTRRQAFYENLPPGNYRFRVIACNNSGVWNEEGEFIDIRIPPMYYQTTWFRLSLVAAFLLLVLLVYQLRLRQVARRFNIRLEERVGERTRIARDLHDTLLQSFQGVVYKFYAANMLLPDNPVEAQKNFETVLSQATEAINEGRHAVQGLRSSTVVSNELAQAIAAFGEELLTDQVTPDPPSFRVEVEGAARNLVPLVRDEVYRIVVEALRNAFEHASASQIEVDIRYGRRQLHLQIRDDGKGVNQKVIAAGGREGHFGLAGMRERAELVGGKLTIWSQIDSGTEVDLKIPGVLAYAKTKGPKRWGLFKKKR